MPVLTVSAASQLANAGKLNGRMVAVGGYWAEAFLPCPFKSHAALLEGFCYAAGFADSPDAAVAMTQNTASSFAPIAGPETEGTGELNSGQSQDSPAAAVLILHGDDSRVWQCTPNEQRACQRRLVIDRVAWVNGAAIDLTGQNTDLSPTLTLLQVSAAGVRDGDQLVTAYLLAATSLNDVDPRFLGSASDLVWYVRAATGSPDADGVIDAVARLVSDASSEVVAELPMVVADDYRPGRLVLTSDDRIAGGNDSSYPRYAVMSGEVPVALDFLGSGSTPLAIGPGDFTVKAFRTDQDGAVVNGPECDLPITVESASDSAYTATFTQDRCTWSEGVEQF